MLQQQAVSLSEVRSRVVGASFYPFKPGQAVPTRFAFVHTFTFIVSGRGRMTLNGEAYMAEARQLFYMEPGTLHSFQADSEEPMIHASVYVDLLSPSTPKQKGDRQLNTYDYLTADRSLCAAGVQFTEGFVLPVCSRIPPNAEWIDSFLSVIELFPEPFPGTDILLRARFEAFLIPHIRYLLQPTPDFYDPRIAKLIQWLGEIRGERIPIAAWARRLGISTAYLYELFRRQTGTSPQAYELRAKLDKAKAYLRETDLPVTEIACRLGFSSLHYFTRQFTKQMREPPSHYRSRFRRHG
ncbi:helix-turn-helix domain-containing protein [Paenibacillus sp. TAB 01]|uniref:AraC family transcriptional regulator n=1 Tax=Paenibacillus sp. TAB 01 TaxID=3368988 RepID=UPI00375104B8